VESRAGGRTSASAEDDQKTDVWASETGLIKSAGVACELKKKMLTAMRLSVTLGQ
jgi:hypothetical protein